MDVRRGSTKIPLLIGLLVADGSLVACHKDKAGTVDVAPNKASLRRSYDALEPQLSALTTKFSALRKQLETLPPDLPGLADVRGKLFAGEEVLGVTSAKLTWLSGQIDSALRAGRVDDLQQVSKELGAAADDIRQVDRVGLELTHQLSSFERTAALR